MKRMFCFVTAICLLWVFQCVCAEGEGLVSVEPITQRNETAEYAQIRRIEGEMTHEGQTDVYQLTVPEDGRVRLEISELYDYAKVALLVYNTRGECVAQDKYCGNGEGVTLKDLKAGEQYEIRVTQLEKLSRYILSIGLPKAQLDISEITRLVDHMEYTDQRNVYTLNVRRDGAARLEVCEMMAGTVVSIKVFDRLNQEVASDTYAMNGDGVTLTGLKAGESYSVRVYQCEGLGEYTLLIGQQKETVYCEAGTVISDSVEYTDQKNVYMVTVNEDGNLSVTLQETVAGHAVQLRIYNRLLELVARDNYTLNGDCLTLEGVKAGEEYMVQVRQAEGFCDYQIRID